MQELINRWQAGDEAAFDELFHQYKKLVFKNVNHAYFSWTELT